MNNRQLRGFFKKSFERRTYHSRTTSASPVLLNHHHQVHLTQRLLEIAMKSALRGGRQRKKRPHRSIKEARGTGASHSRNTLLHLCLRLGLRVLSIRTTVTTESLRFRLTRGLLSCHTYGIRVRWCCIVGAALLAEGVLIRVEDGPRLGTDWTGCVVSLLGRCGH